MNQPSDSTRVFEVAVKSGDRCHEVKHKVDISIDMSVMYLYQCNMYDSASSQRWIDVT